MIGTCYDISRIDSHSVQFDDATTARFHYRGSYDNARQILTKIAKPLLRRLKNVSGSSY